MALTTKHHTLFEFFFDPLHGPVRIIRVAVSITTFGFWIDMVEVKF